MRLQKQKGCTAGAVHPKNTRHPIVATQLLMVLSAHEAGACVFTKKNTRRREPYSKAIMWQSHHTMFSVDLQDFDHKKFQETAYNTIQSSEKHINTRIFGHVRFFEKLFVDFVFERN